ncbi:MULTISPECIES: ABC transporter ATP-binding protein [unclassified Paenibacillus]|uniref:ATP-binding cassette domain-containing protein n=1 Tax=unclassified Paenibacillus TaxID=185978 RepID=UPI001AE6A087|nr:MULTISPECIES: ABC transporter ATP-binding protein [unclassified Paenibacillus]MBP1154673.1 ABC-2 type transport system ATP-binding protein [Paenibacillus sp. PvP091]MBP1169943.1 ABC-2 type transport system ATP-binding protein [Paenibacillus sp. PvR098]MBP2440971.1 ABC-2 type transport system ATP-binding protein [Paenibacillus sp. PvP052]
MIRIRQVVVTAEQFELQIAQLDLTPGITIVVGRNGAGKSTLLRLLATAVDPVSGYIEYAGHRPQESLPLIRRNIGFLPSGLELYEDLTPRKLLNYLSSLKGIVDKEETDRWLASARLQKQADRAISQLSQGQQQRLGIAQACLGSPAFLFLDEPLTYLDSMEQKHFIHLMGEYARHRVVVVATHEINEWQYQASTIVWLDEGRVRFAGSPALWLSELPYDIWCGSVPSEQVPKLDYSRMLQCKFQRERTEIRWIGEAPDNGMGEHVFPTLEDAYFIRRYALDKK